MKPERKKELLKYPCWKMKTVRFALITEFDVLARVTYFTQVDILKKNSFFFKVLRLS